MGSSWSAPSSCGDGKEPVNTCTDLHYGVTVLWIVWARREPGVLQEQEPISSPIVGM